MNTQCSHIDSLSASNKWYRNYFFWLAHLLLYPHTISTQTTFDPKYKLLRLKFFNYLNLVSVGKYSMQWKCIEI